MSQLVDPAKFQMATCTEEQAKYILWSRGETAYRLHEGQKKIQQAYLNSKHHVFAAECSRQFGKTSWGVWLADQTARRHPGSSIRVATAFFADIEAFILPAFSWLFQDCPEAFKPIYHAGKAKWLYSNGSEIQLVGLDRNPNKLRGNRLRLILLEEIGFSDSDKLKYAYESVIIPATTHEREAKIVLISTPPASGNDHFFCTLADVAAVKNSYIKFTVYDNPMLTKKRIEEIAESIGGKDSVAFRREYMCERIVDAIRAIIPEFKEDKHVMPVEPPTDGRFTYYHRYEALDSGVRDQTVILFGYYDFPRGKLVVQDEVVLQGHEVDTRRIARECRIKEYDHWSVDRASTETLPVYRRVSDNDNLILLADLGREYGLHFTATSKDTLEAMVNKLRLWFQDNKIEIHPRCKHLIGTLKSALWNKTRDKFERSPAYGHADALAALMYFVRNVDPHVNPLPPGWGINKIETYVLHHQTRLSKAAMAFTETFGLKPRRK